MICKHRDQPHTIWYWLEDPNDPAPAPYSVKLDNYADAIAIVNDWLKETPIIALRWIKVFRSDNEAYTCFQWINPEPMPKKPSGITYTPVDTIKRWQFWRH